MRRPWPMTRPVYLYVFGKEGGPYKVGRSGSRA